MNLEKLEQQLNLKFEDPKLIENALIHRSYLNEHPEQKLVSNERLEFLGDAVLELLASERLYQLFPGSPEGDLTNFRAALVCTKSLASEARRLALGEHLFLSRGEEDSGGRDREYILANTFEALLGAIYLDQGLPPCQTFLEKHLFFKIDEIVANKTYKDAKSVFQEVIQEEIGLTPTYQVLEDWGPDHAKSFRMGVFIKDIKVGEGEGGSKQEGEQSAAQNALENWDTVKVQFLEPS